MKKSRAAIRGGIYRRTAGLPPGRPQVQNRSMPAALARNFMPPPASGCRFTANQFSNAHAEIVVEHQHFATGNEPPVGIDIDRVASKLIERHHCSLLHP